MDEYNSWPEKKSRRATLLSFGAIMLMWLLLLAAVVLANGGEANAQVVTAQGYYSSSLPTYASGTFVPLSLGQRGEQIVTIFQAGQSATVRSGAADGLSNTTGVLSTLNFHELYNGSTWNMARDTTGAITVGSGTGVMAVEENGRLYAHQNTNATFTVKASSGFVHNLFVGTPGTGETITCYDNASTATGTVIFVFTPANAGANILDARFALGLTCVTAGTTPGDYTFLYR